MSEIWFVRAGRDSAFAEDFTQQGVVAIGWADLGDLLPTITKPQLIQQYRQTYQEHANGRVQVAASQIIRFMNEVKLNDFIMTHDRDTQLYHLGTITSPCLWKPDIISELPRIRTVEWKHTVARATLSIEAKNSLGAIQTLFQIKGSVASEILSKATAVSGLPITPPTTPSLPTDQLEAERQVQAELLEKAELSIEDRIVRLEWDQVQELVAGILRAMNYRTTISPRGSDRGVDIFASPDGLGLEEPRIFVEVKHRPTTTMGSTDIRSFLGGRSSTDKCLYVSTGGFTREARYEADRANIAIRLLGLVDLRKLLVDYYEKLDEEVKSLIPLRRIYILAD